MPELGEAVREDSAISPDMAVKIKPLPLRRGFLVLLLPLSMALSALASRYPEITETIYSRGINRFLRGILGRISGLLAFSIAEILLYILIILSLIWLMIQVSQFFRGERKKRRALYMLANIGAFAGVFYFIFIISCGLGYSRVTFADQSGLVIRDSSVEEVAGLYAQLVMAANDLRPMIEEDENGVALLRESPYETAKAVRSGMDRLAVKYPVLSGYTPTAKPVLASRGMSYLNITGIYIPYTFEANVNIDAPGHSLPFTMLHEISHFKGFMREDEANFIAYLACRESESAIIRYSGTVVALTYAGNALYSADPELYSQIAGHLDEGVWRDFACSSAYWRQFEGPVAEAASAVNDGYLKSNRQLDGVKSYGRMTDLLLADYRQR